MPRDLHNGHIHHPAHFCGSNCPQYTVIPLQPVIEGNYRVDMPGDSRHGEACDVIVRNTDGRYCVRFADGSTALYERTNLRAVVRIRV